MIDSDRIAAIEARCEAATPGPWEHPETSNYIMTDRKDLNEAVRIATVDRIWLEPIENWRANASFIAHARADIPWLLAEIKRLREAQRWIPVSERLPEVGKCVLIRQTYHAILGEHGEYEGITVGYLHQPTDRRGKPYFYWAAVSDYGDMVRAQSICPGNEFITHWMPLPAAPEKGE